jgi:hypothetical protein
MTSVRDMFHWLVGNLEANEDGGVFLNTPFQLGDAITLNIHNEKSTGKDLLVQFTTLLDETGTILHYKCLVCGFKQCVEIKAHGFVLHRLPCPMQHYGYLIAMHGDKVDSERWPPVEYEFVKPQPYQYEGLNGAEYEWHAAGGLYLRKKT